MVAVRNGSPQWPCLPIETNYSHGMSDKKWDVFICHASEDKDFFVRPLAVSLNQLGVEVWYDEFSLRLGDCLSRSIDHGLANSHFGIVVISANFIGKAWPERELGGLVSREIGQGRVIPSFARGTRSPWECYAFAKTEMARKRPFHVALGRTKEEAEQKLMEEYKRCATKYGTQVETNSSRTR